MVFHVEACWGGLPTRVQKTKIYNLETGEFASTPPFSKKAFGRSYPVGQVCVGILELLIYFTFFLIFLPNFFILFPPNRFLPKSNPQDSSRQMLFLKMAGCKQTHRFLGYRFFFLNARWKPSPTRFRMQHHRKVRQWQGWGILNKGTTMRTSTKEQ